MSAGFERRFLRPRYVFFSCGYVLVVDERQPVAAMFDPHTEQLVRLVSWTELPPAPPGSGQPEIIADDAGVWVQNHRDGPLVRVGVDGIVNAEYTEHHRLICCGPAGAWCMTIPRRRPDVAPSPDIPPRRLPSRSALLVAFPGGGSRRVAVDGALLSVEFDESSLFVGIEHDPWVRVPKGAGGRDGYEVHYSTSVMQVPLSGPIPERIGPDTHPYAQDRDPGYTSEYADMSYNEAHRRKRAFGDGIRWYWGKDPARSDTTIVRAYRDQRPDPLRSFAVPEVRVTHGAAGFDRLWLVVTPESGSGRGRSVLTGGVDDDALHPLPVEGIDITEQCWPVGAAPLDHDSYVQYCLRGLDGMRFSDTVSDVTARYAGHWPAGQIHIGFRHVNYPGLALVARRNLYDEQGVRLEDFRKYVPVELMEQADTCAYPPPSDAADGVLYV